MPAGDVRRGVAAGLSYLSNNAARMDYPRYRRLGLPTKSRLVESLVGDVNGRVKSTQKYWNRPGGAEAIRQVRAAYPSEDGRLQRYFAQRPGNLYRRRAAWPTDSFAKVFMASTGCVQNLQAQCNPFP